MAALLRNRHLTGWLLASPLAAVQAFFLVLPILMIVVVSFWGATEFSIYPAFEFDNYHFLLTSPVTLQVFLNTFKYALVTWALTLGIGFTVAYFPAFHVRSQTWQIALFLLCTIPFWTSNIIRMISWIPFLGRNGLANSTPISWEVIDELLEWLLFSDFSAILAFVHLYTLFMVVPIFNTMMRIDRSLIEAANDAGATGFRIMANVIIPLCKPGIMIGSIFVVTLVMGGLAFRKRFAGSGVLFHLVVTALVIPSILISLGVGLIFNQTGLDVHWSTSGFGAQLTWTLPFGLLIMFAVFNRFDKSYEEAARDLGASPWQTIAHVVLRIIAPSLIGVALFGFTLSDDEFARTLPTAGSRNTLPLEIHGMTTNVTTPGFFALGTLTTLFSFLVIGVFLTTVRALNRRRARAGSDAGKGMVQVHGLRLHQPQFHRRDDRPGACHGPHRPARRPVRGLDLDPWPSRDPGPRGWRGRGAAPAGPGRAGRSGGRCGGCDRLFRRYRP